jgi:predicted transcriptional regulator
MPEDAGNKHASQLATELTIAWLSNPNTRASAEEVPGFLKKIHGAVTTLTAPPAQGAEAATTPEYMPAVTARRSLASKDHIISMIDGKPYKALKRHLARHGLTPQQYREGYGLKSDYPMVAENYAEMRRRLAKQFGLGRNPGEKRPAKPTTSRRGAKAAAAEPPAPA